MKTFKNKTEARKFAFDLIKGLKEENRQRRKEEIIELLKTNKKFLEAKKVALYYPLAHEVNLLEIMDLFPLKQYYFPRTEKILMEFKLVTDLNDLVEGNFSLKEPSKSLLTENDIDVYLVPCLISTKRYRIGHGAGYYDRYFTDNDGYKIGVVYKELKDLNVSVNEFDVPLDLIL